MADDAAEIWGHDEYRFHGQRPDEQVMLLKNQHPVVLTKTILWLFVSGIIPYLLLLLSDGRYTFMGIAIYGFLVLFIAWYRWYGYQNSVSILTNQRILQVSQHGFFNRQINEAELSRIQDVSSEIKGVAQTIFGYGDVTIRTASKDSLLVLKDIRAPYDFQQAIVRSLKDKA